MALFVNLYRCPSCGGKWRDVWSATCDDDCRHCGERHISPYTSLDVPEEEDDELALEDEDEEPTPDSGPVGFV